MCGDCRRSVIDTPEELEEVRQAALAIIATHIGSNNLDRIPVELKKELAHGVTSGRLGVAMNREDLTLLLLESGLPESFAISAKGSRTNPWILSSEIARICELTGSECSMEKVLMTDWG